jgi:hypothetical protein
MSECEPVVTLSDGTEVLVAVADAVHRLLATDHLVLVIDGAVGVHPPIDEDAHYLLASNCYDVQAVLDVRDAENRRTLEALGETPGRLEADLRAALAGLVREDGPAVGC